VVWAVHFLTLLLDVEHGRMKSQQRNVHTGSGGLPNPDELPLEIPPKDIFHHRRRKSLSSRVALPDMHELSHNEATQVKYQYQYIALEKNRSLPQDSKSSRPSRLLQ